MTKNLNTKLLTDALIASLIVNQATDFVNQKFLQNMQLSGIMLDVLGAGLAYFVGKIMKHDNVGTIGIALAGANVAGSFLNQYLLGAGKTTPPTMPTSSSAGMLSPKKSSQSMNDYQFMPMRDYINGAQAGDVAQYQDYVDAYAY